MKAFKTRIKLKDLKSIMEIPKDIISQEVEIIILSDTVSRKSLSVKRERGKVGGILNRYADSSLIKNGKDNSRTKIIESKHGLLWCQYCSFAENMKSNFYRKIVSSDTINLDLPEELKHRQVEIIILPYGENKKKSQKHFSNDIKGLWKDSEITLDEIRNKAWER